MVTAEQVTAALTGGVVTTAVNIAAVRPEVMEALAPFVPLCEKLGRLAQGLADGSVDRVEVEFRGRLAEEDTRLLGIAVLAGILRPHRGAGQPRQRPAAGGGARHRADRDREAASEDFTELVVVRIRSGEEAVEVAGTGVGPRNDPHLVRVWGEDFYLPFAEHLAIFRYADQPGMIGRVGTVFGEEGVNIVSAAVGAEPGGERAVMALTTDAPVNQSTIDRILELDGFSVGRAVSPVALDRAAHEGGRADRPRRAGGAQVEERPDPEVGPGEVRIAVRAAGINFADTLARVGLYPDAPKPPCVLGYEVAGEVESVGEGVTDFKPGDRVMAGTRFGGQASTGRVDAEQVLPLPERLSFEQGAAFPVNYATAYAALVSWAA